MTRRSVLYDAPLRHRQTIRDANDVVLELRHLVSAEQEVLWVLGLNARHKILTSACAAIGTADHVAVSPRDVFRELIRRNCLAFIIAHNHPSGESTPSPQDETLTRKLASAGELLGVKLLDHTIIACEGRYSFAEQGYLDAIWTARTP